MYLIDKSKNRVEKISKTTFSELNFQERAHLQEWIANSPEILGEDLLIIQKEYAGWKDTKERLDLLALDKDGNLVIIENKLDESGRNVTWQALKYASYCSTLTKEDIRQMFQDYLGSAKNAESTLSEFFGGSEYDELTLNRIQRIIMVSANFPKEVTSTVLWLMSYKLRIQCIKVTPYKLGDQYFITPEQIIPTKDAEEFVIKVAGKAQEEASTQESVKSRHLIRMEYWRLLLDRVSGRMGIFQNTSPTKDHWLSSGGTGITGVVYSFAITKDYASVGVGINRSVPEENKILFDALKEYQKEIEKEFGDKLDWERLDEKISSRVSYWIGDVSIFDKADWEKMLEFQVENMAKLEKVISPYLKKIKDKLKTAKAEVE